MRPLVLNEATRKASEDLISRNRELTSGRPNYYMNGPPCLDEQQLAQLRAHVDETGAPAEVMAHHVQKQVPTVRRTRVCWLDMDTHRWVYDLVWTIANAANEHLRYDIGPAPEQIQLARYDAGEQGFFDWHADTVPSDMTRKISISIPLNPASEYEGGVLELHQGTSIVKADQPCGRPIIFPSWLIHRVSPVTRGQRYSLVAWIRGPNWR